MKYLTQLYLLFFFFINSSYGYDESAQLKESTKEVIKGIREFNMPVNALECSVNPLDSQKKSCASITDNFCKELWNEKNSGNIKVFDGQILAGKSPKTDIDLSTLANDKALIDSIDRLPADIKKQLSPTIEKLAILLNNETSSPKWHFDYTGIKMAIKRGMDSVANERYDKKNSTKVENRDKWTIPESINYQNETRKVFDEITIAKYKKHPNWLRVETAYVKAKNLLLKNIETLDIPVNKKNELKSKIASVELTLPSLDPNLMGSKECASTEVNAYYKPLTNKFTVCAGYFNRNQSESSLIFIIAHELGHSIDSETQANDKWKNEGSISTKLKPLIKSKNQTYSCNEWKSMNKKTFVVPTKFEIIKSPLDKLYSCLRGDVKVNELNLSSVLSVVEQQVKTEIEKLTNLNAFSNLIEKTQNIENEILDNEAYYRPDIQIAAWRGYNEENQNRSVDSTEVFMQSFYCILESHNLGKKEFESASSELKASILKKAMEQTTKIKIMEKTQYYSYCGENCSGLANSNLAVDISERSADWLAASAYPEYLKTLKPENREQASALSTSLFCISGKEGIDHTLEEKAFYADNRHRRVSLYTPKISKIIGCGVQANDEGDSKCNP